MRLLILTVVTTILFISNPFLHLAYADGALGYEGLCKSNPGLCDSSNSNSGSTESTTTTGSQKKGYNELDHLEEDLDSDIDVKEGTASSELGACTSAANSAAAGCAINDPSLQMLLDFGTSVGGTVGATNPASICRRAKTVAAATAGANATFAAICEGFAGNCTRQCGKMAEDADEQFKMYLNKARYHAKAAKASTSEATKVAEGAAYKDAKARMKEQKIVAYKAKNLWGICKQYRATSILPLAKAAMLATKAATAGDCGELDNSDPNKICQKPENRGLAICLAQNSCNDPIRQKNDPNCLRNGGGGGGGPGGFPGPIGPKIGGDPGSGDLDPLGELNKPKGDIGSNSPGTQTRNDGVGGGGGGGPQGAGGGALNPEEGGGAAAGYNTSLDEGYQRTRGGGGGGGFFASGGGSGNRGSGGSGKDGGFDISKYLPNLRNKGQARSIAEVDKLKAEGVTAASGPSIWDKVTTRMRAIRGRLQ